MLGWFRGGGATIDFVGRKPPPGIGAREWTNRKAKKGCRSSRRRDRPDKYLSLRSPAEGRRSPRNVTEGDRLFSPAAPVRTHDKAFFNISAELPGREHKDEIIVIGA